MKKLIVSLMLMITFASINGQVPFYFNYQAVVRNSSGQLLANQKVKFRLSIYKGAPGIIVYAETQNDTTNNFGLANLVVGKGTVVAGTNLSGIDWGNGTYFLGIEIDPTVGSDYLEIGRMQLLSVPYAFYAEKAKTSGDTFKAGSGISISGKIISNTKPDQIVTLNPGTAINITGTYPVFTIQNSSPDRVVTLSGTGSTTISGIYPNFTINSNPNDTSSTNEIQELNFSNDTLSISNANYVKLPYVRTGNVNSGSLALLNKNKLLDTSIVKADTTVYINARPTITSRFSTFITPSATSASTLRWAIYGSSLGGNKNSGSGWTYNSLGGGGLMGISEKPGKYNAGVLVS